jgi:hypothetical protein
MLQTLQVREQGNQVTKLQAELQLLEGSLQDSQRQAMALGTRLTLTESKNDELISQNQVGKLTHHCRTGATQPCFYSLQ